MGSLRRGRGGPGQPALPRGERELSGEVGRGAAQGAICRSSPEGTIWCQRWDEVPAPPPSDSQPPLLSGPRVWGQHPLPQRYRTPGPSP